jgi:glycosyltransferase involved in cell wall biosynthesis
LATIGEPMPIGEGARDRLHRTGYFAHFLAERGHDVTWWTSTFDHVRKKHCLGEDSTIEIGPRLRMRLLHGCGYKSNLSLARIRDQRQVARKFAHFIRQEEGPPQIIVAALPVVEICLAAVKYGRQRGVPVVLDMRDMWPDLFVELAPRPLRPIARLVLAPLFREARAACAGATAIIGVTDPFVEWGLRRGGRTRGPWDRSFGFGYVQSPLPAEQLAAAEEFWRQQGVGRDDGRFTVCFFGTLSRQFELEAVITAARTLRAAGRPVRFVLCGAGERLEEYRAQAAGLDNVLLPGWIGAAQIQTLMRVSALGLAPYRDTPNFTMNIPNKPAEYFSAGLPVALALKHGVLCDLLAQRNCGFSYGNDADELVRSINGLCDDREKLRELSGNALRVFEEQFTAEKVYGDMMAYLEAVAASAGRAAP